MEDNAILFYQHPISLIFQPNEYGEGITAEVFFNIITDNNTLFTETTILNFLKGYGANKGFYSATGYFMFDNQPEKGVAVIYGVGGILVDNDFLIGGIYVNPIGGYQETLTISLNNCNLNIYEPIPLQTSIQHFVNHSITNIKLC